MEPNDTGNYFTLSIKHLTPGMVLPDDIYNSGRSVLLLRQGFVLTEDVLYRLQNFNGLETVSVSSAVVAMIMDQKPDETQTSQQVYEEEFGYKKLTQRTQAVFESAAVRERISDRETVEIMEDISQKLSVSTPEDIFRCIDAPRMVDEALFRHSINVSFLNGLMAKWLGLREELHRPLVLTGLLHDIGKTKIPREILDAPRKLTEAEFAIVKHHPTYSYSLLAKDYEQMVLDGVLYHHERESGSGYPEGRKADHIPLFAKITAVSDVYDALISKRSYKEAIQPFKILEQLATQEFKGLDISLTITFCANMALRFMNRQVLMSDGNMGIVRFVPPNDLGCPVVEVDGVLRQADDRWQCMQVAAGKDPH